MALRGSFSAIFRLFTLEVLALVSGNDCLASAPSVFAVNYVVNTLKVVIVLFAMVTRIDATSTSCSSQPAGTTTSLLSITRYSRRAHSSPSLIAAGKLRFFVLVVVSEFFGPLEV
jgi:hypothetical protein